MTTRTSPTVPRVETVEPSLPSIPAHWQLLRIRNVGKAIIGLTYSPDDVVDEADAGTLVLRAGNIQDGRLDFTDNVYVAKPVPVGLRLRPGDIVICARNGSADLIGKSAVATAEVAGQTWGAFMAVLRSEHNEYLRWVLNSRIFEAQTGLYSTATINQLTSATLHNLRFAMPPPDEQRAIAGYLDRETARIDILIEEQQRLIEMLQERRISAVTKLVAGGFRTEMGATDSVWYPLIPVGWERGRVKSFATRVTDGAHISPERDGGVYDFVSTRDVKAGRIDFAGSLKTSPDTYEYMVRTGCRPMPGDVLFSKDGTVGETAVVREEREFVVASSLVIISPDQTLLTPDYLAYVLASKTAREQAVSMMRGAGLPRLSVGNLARLELPLPPLDEQCRIADYLDEQTTKIDTLISETETFIELARERRSALITAAVTGQIDLRDVA